MIHVTIRTVIACADFNMADNIGSINNINKINKINNISNVNNSRELLPRRKRDENEDIIF